MNQCFFPVISYCAAIWSTQSLKCINAFQNRAARYFLNFGSDTPNAAVCGDIGCTPIIYNKMLKISSIILVPKCQNG